MVTIAPNRNLNNVVPAKHTPYTKNLCLMVNLRVDKWTPSFFYRCIIGTLYLNGTHKLHARQYQPIILESLVMFIRWAIKKEKLKICRNLKKFSLQTTLYTSYWIYNLRHFYVFIAHKLVIMKVFKLWIHSHSLLRFSTGLKLEIK